MKNQLKKLSLLTGMVLVFALVSFTTTSDAASFEQANSIVFELVSLDVVSPDGGDVLAPKCGSEKESKAKASEAKTSESKCGEGKCGEGKCGEAKSGEAKTKEASKTGVTSASTKSTDAGKCGDAKSTEATTGTAKTTSKKEAKTTSEGKCGMD